MLKIFLDRKNKQGLNKRICGATLDKENVGKVFLKIKQHNVNIKNSL